MCRISRKQTLSGLVVWMMVLSSTFDYSLSFHNIPTYNFDNCVIIRDDVPILAKGNSNPFRKGRYPVRDTIFPFPSTTLFMSETQSSSSSSYEEEDSSTSASSYYSPNVKLDETRYRYDLDYDDDTNTNVKDEHNNHGNSKNNNNDPNTSSSSSSTNEYSFFDEATIHVRAGSGGQGSSTYQKGVNAQNGPPDGGDGGRGGDVILVADPSLNTLAGLTNAWRPNRFGGGGAQASGRNAGFEARPMGFRAENGGDGGRQFKNGKYGKSVTIRVPLGTVVQEEVDEKILDPETGEDKILKNNKLIEIGTVGESNSSSSTDSTNTLIVASGGDGGEGSGTQGTKKGRGVKRPRTPPVGGERKRLRLTLKVVADVAIVGVPNAGKSTFLSSVTRAKPKIANYPFTTVIPNLGVWVPPNVYGTIDNQKTKFAGSGSSGLILCDVPGLIAGAAEGVGLGHAFLRHVERCHVILHLVDATSVDPIADFQMLNREIVRYGNGSLAQMPQIVVVNKIDAWEEKHVGEDWEKGLKTKFDKEILESSLREEMTHTRLMWMSAKKKDGVDDLMTRMAAFVNKVKESNTNS
mmetsp:Transcript_20675/g.29042  ORF Transcript_20675/g.29042 Transcript_20675/m.29042 type:complete len:578 (+) Transcript_20675:143-1876(+)